MKQIIEEIAFRNGYRLQDIFKDISLILFQMCFRHNNGQVLVFCNDKKLFKLYFILGNVHCMYCHAHTNHHLNFNSTYCALSLLATSTRCTLKETTLSFYFCIKLDDSRDLSKRMISPRVFKVESVEKKNAHNAISKICD